jgi:hypothetical protein
MATKKTPTAANIKLNKTRGGKREGAGREKVYTLMEKMAIFLRIAEIQKQTYCSKNKAIEIMQSSGELPAHCVSNIGRYTAPSHLSKEIQKMLKDAPLREGMISLIGNPTQVRTKKSKT